MDFANKWKADAAFRDAIQECFQWVLRNEAEIDLVQNENGSYCIQVALKDARGTFFTEPVMVRRNMDVDAMFGRAMQKAREGRILKIANRPAAARAA
jgi:hypothetical protein